MELRIKMLEMATNLGKKQLAIEIIPFNNYTLCVKIYIFNKQRTNL